MLINDDFYNKELYDKMVAMMGIPLGYGFRFFYIFYISLYFR